MNKELRTIYVPVKVEDELPVKAGGIIVMQAIIFLVMIGFMMENFRAILSPIGSNPPQP